MNKELQEALVKLAEATQMVRVRAEVVEDRKEALQAAQLDFDERSAALDAALHDQNEAIARVREIGRW